MSAIARSVYAPAADWLELAGEAKAFAGES
jgi:hypothetical protein